MYEPESGKLFQGNELPKLLLLLAIAVCGWVAVWQYLVRTPVGGVDAEPLVTARPVAVKPDRSPEYETVVDKTTIAFRDSAAYAKLLDRARETSPADLSAQARRDLFYAHLWDHPKDYRGIPVHLLGTARRILYYESKLSKSGWLYEAWVFTPDGQNNPYVCVFEDAPKKFPIGANLSERIAFDGYFLKLLRYEAGDVPRAAPLLVGRLKWFEVVEPAPSNRSTYLLAGGLAVMFTISMARWLIHLRRSFAPRPRPSFLRARPNEDIAPDQLASYLENADDEDEEPPGQDRP